MARGSLARRLLVAGAFVWVARQVIASSEAKPAPAPIELPDDVPEAAVVPSAPRSAFRKRFATSLAFSMLFFGGAAFTAGAGNQVAPDVTSTDATATVVTDATAPVAAAPDATAAAPTPVAAAPAPAAPVATAPADPAAAAAAAPAPAPAPATTDQAPTATPSDAIAVPSSVAAVTPAPVHAAPPSAVHPKRHAARHARRVASVVMPVHVAIPYAAIAFDPQVWLHQNGASLTGQSAIAIAQHYVGVPYVWGGAIPMTGFDCSGFTQFVYAQLGVNLPHYAASQFAAFPKLDPSQLQPGDLVFFEPKVDGPGHVAIYVGNDQMIEAPHTGALVRVSSFSAAAAAMGFLGAVRPYTVVVYTASPRAAATSARLA